MITHWEQLPVVLQPEHMADLLDVSIPTIWKRCRAKTMWPAPNTWSRPYLWSRQRVEQEIDRPPSPVKARARRPVKTTFAKRPMDPLSPKATAARLLAFANGQSA